MTMPSTKRSPGSVPGHAPGSSKATEPFGPGPVNKGADSTGGSLEAQTEGTARDPNKG